MSGTSKYPQKTTWYYDRLRRLQAEDAYRRHLALVGRTGDRFSVHDVIDFALQLLIDLQGDIEASSALFKATALEEITRSHVLLQGQLEAIHELILTMHNPPPNDDQGRKQWAARTVAQIEAQVISGVRRIPMLHKAILHDEKQIAESIRRRRE